MSIRANTKFAFVVAASIGALAAFGAIAGARYTSQTTFCASCHEMQGMHSGWSKGTHADVHCYDCHVDKNLSAHCMAKVNGLRQLFIHFTGDVNMEEVTTAVPSHRCTSCHNMADEVKLGARIVTAHLKHTEAKLECTLCHLRSGHSREGFVGFVNESCNECHSRKPQAVSATYLKRPPCTR